MKTLLVLFLLFCTTSFANKEPDERWIGSLDLFVNEDNEFILYYHGKYQYCYMKEVVDALYPECDSISGIDPQIRTMLRSLKVIEVVPDTIPKEMESNPKLKTSKI